ncbi:MAG: hypothetical protein Q8O25_05805 [Sulfurisoma sp.]|nr:hypothetical protein [Sulfurisoma sp.]
MKLQLDYVPVEDRLLLRIENEGRAIAVWLTRRMTALTWDALWRVVSASLGGGATSEARDWLLGLAHEESQRRHVVTREPPLPLQQEPFLVVTLQLGNGDDGLYRLRLVDPAGRCEIVDMEEDAIHGLIRMIESACVTAEWGLTRHSPNDRLAAMIPIRLQ